MTANGDEVSFRGNENVLKLDYSDGLAQPVNILKSMNHPLQLGINCMAYQLLVKKLFEKEKKQGKRLSQEESSQMLHEAKKYILLFKILSLLFLAHRKK